MVGAGPLPPAGPEPLPVANVPPAAEVPKNGIEDGSTTPPPDTPEPGPVDVEPPPTMEPADPDPTRDPTVPVAATTRCVTGATGWLGAVTAGGAGGSVTGGNEGGGGSVGGGSVGGGGSGGGGGKVIPADSVGVAPPVFAAAAAAPMKPTQTSASAVARPRRQDLVNPPIRF